MGLDQKIIVVELETFPAQVLPGFYGRDLSVITSSFSPLPQRLSALVEQERLCLEQPGDLGYEWAKVECHNIILSFWPAENFRLY